ncbi:MAG: SDR family oxidoreductase [Calditrichota bacterium]
MSSKILVIGASGTVGSELVKLLQFSGQNVVRATSKKELEEDQVHVNLQTGEGISEAFVDIDRAFFLTPAGHVNPQKITGKLVDAAKANGVQKVVLMTAMGVDADDNIPLRQAEIILEKSGLNYNIIRPNWFMQNFNSYWIAGILQHQKIFLPVGDARGSFIDTRDIAAVAAELLVTDSRNNEAFNLTGEESLNHTEVAEILSEVTGKTITYEDIPPSAMKESLLEAGMSKEYTELLLGILEAFKLGYSATVSSNVRDIIGRVPITLRQYAEDYKSAWS